MTETNGGCEYGPLLSPLHDGELPAARAAEVLAHAQTCPACSAELRAMRRLSGAFASVVLPAPPPSLASLRPDDAPGQPRMRLAGSDPADGAAAAEESYREPRHLRIIRVLTAVAAVVFLIALGGIAYQQYYRTGPTPHNVSPIDTVGGKSGSTRPGAQPVPSPAEFQVVPRQAPGR